MFFLYYLRVGLWLSLKARNPTLRLHQTTGLAISTHIVSFHKIERKHCTRIVSMFCFRFRCERQDGWGVWDNLKETAGLMLNRWKPKNSRVVWNCSRWQECCEIGGGAWWERRRGERVRWEWSEASSIRESDCWLAWCCQTHWDQVSPNRGDVMLIVLRRNLGQVRWWQGLGISGYISTGIGGRK